MAYTIYNADGTTTIVDDNSISQKFYDTVNKVGVQLVGRNAIDYGAPTAQNFLQMLENFAGTHTPGSNGATAPTGMLWYDLATNTMKIKTASGWDAIVSSGGGGGGTVTIPDLMSTNIGTVGTPVSNIYVTDVWGGTFHGVATTADYADLAERYEADKPLQPGTVVSLGGEKEITTTATRADISVFGVVSHRPGLMLNASAGDNETHPYIALSGRVPVFVQGKVKKNQRLISSSTPGVAEAIDDEELSNFSTYQIIGRALQSKTTNGIGQILAVVGVK